VKPDQFDINAHRKQLHVATDKKVCKLLRNAQRNGHRTPRSDSARSGASTPPTKSPATPKESSNDTARRNENGPDR
jgi:hypothetical protein